MSSGQSQTRLMRRDAVDERLHMAGAAVLLAMLTWLGAMVHIPLRPFGVPMTLQTLFVVLAALAVGPRVGMLAMVTYIIAGAIGVPVFSDGGAGLTTLFGQTGGYILGFLAAQPVANWFVRRRDRTIRRWPYILCGALAAHLVIFTLGVPWIWMTRRLDPDAAAITWSAAVSGGFVVFIPGMLLKSVAATILGTWLAPISARRGW